MTPRHILILDCTPTYEPSEGQLLKHFFKICQLKKPEKASSLYYKIKSKRAFLNKLGSPKKWDIVHISAHGLAERQDVIIGNGSSWSVTPDEIRDYSQLRAKLVFANACLNNRQTMAEAFEGCNYFLAPDTEVDWDKAAIFSLLFYQRYILHGTSMKSAFNYARERSGAATDYPDLWV